MSFPQCIFTIVESVFPSTFGLNNEDFQVRVVSLSVVSEHSCQNSGVRIDTYSFLKIVGGERESFNDYECPVIEKWAGDGWDKENK